jgi:diguanylate cyclase (GGDEF)-like protein
VFVGVTVPLQQLQDPLVAIAGLLIATISATRGSGRIRHVRAWIAGGFAAWAASTLVVALSIRIRGIPPEATSVGLLGVVAIAAGGAYWADLHGRVSRREELAVYLDAGIVAAAATALLLAFFRLAGGAPGSALSGPMIHAVVFLAILAGTLILDLAVLAELRASGAYAILIGLAMVGFGFVGRSSGFVADAGWPMPALVSAGVLVVAFGTATWSDRMDARPSYARIAQRLRGWLPLAAVAVILVLLFVDREAGGEMAVVGDISVAFVLAGTVMRQSVLLTERGGLLGETRRRSEQLERRLASQRQLLAITERLVAHRERTAVFEAVADTLADVVPHDTLSIYVVDRAAGCLVPILARDEYAAQILASRPALGQGITGDVIAKGEAEIINDATHDPRVVHVPGTPTDQEEAMIVAPIRNAEGVIGALNIYRTRRDFDAEDLELVRLFTNHVAIALENATIHDRLIDAAVTDPLTGLPNRRLFAERIDQALERRRDGEQVAVLFLDVDGFKLVNDSLGHSAGDGALRAVAERLRQGARASDVVARLGGDEFGVLCEGIRSEEDVVAACGRIVEALGRPVHIGGRTIAIRASIGVALDRAQPGPTAEHLLRDADIAMYRAKATHRGGFEIFEESMRARQITRLELEEELGRALGEGQFRVVYQPVVSLRTSQVVAVEALLRWDHPTRSIDTPEFIRLAEESGYIVELGAWVRQEACRQARAWQRAYGSAHSLGVSVNVSPREIVEQGFVESVLTALTDSGLAPACLTLEITEGVMLADETAAIAALRSLRAMGVHIVVDDFGTGYSSLSYLKRLPVDGLKIDRSFIEGLGVERERSAIVRATIAFARALGLVVTAEGVENADQLRHLRAMRCDLGQGYHWAPPMRPARIGELLSGGLFALADSIGDLQEGSAA